MASVTNSAPLAGAGTGAPAPTTQRPFLPKVPCEHIASYLINLEAPNLETMSDIRTLSQTSKSVRSGFGWVANKLKPLYRNAIIAKIAENTRIRSWPKMGDVGEPNTTRYKLNEWVNCGTISLTEANATNHSVHFVERRVEPRQTMLECCDAAIALDQRPHILQDIKKYSFWMVDPEVSVIMVNGDRETERTFSFEFPAKLGFYGPIGKNTVRGNGAMNLAFLRALKDPEKMEFSPILFWNFLHNQFEESYKDEQALSEDECIEGIGLLMQTKGASEALEKLTCQVLDLNKPEKAALFQRAVPEWREALSKEGLPETATWEELVNERNQLRDHRPYEAKAEFGRRDTYFDELGRSSSVTRFRVVETRFGQALNRPIYYRPHIQKRLSEDFFTWFTNTRTSTEYKFDLEQYNFFKEKGMLDAWKTVKFHEVEATRLPKDVKSAIFRDAESIEGTPEELASLFLTELED